MKQKENGQERALERVSGQEGADFADGMYKIFMVIFFNSSLAILLFISQFTQSPFISQTMILGWNFCLVVRTTIPLKSLNHEQEFTLMPFMFNFGTRSILTAGSCHQFLYCNFFIRGPIC